MKLSPELAKKIIFEAQSAINEQFIVVDQTAHIIASSDPKRTGNYHEGADIAIRSNREVYISERDVERLDGVKPGINVPIRFHDQILGAIGITGTPEKVRPFVDILRRMTELLIHEAYQAAQLEWKTRGIEAFVYEWLNSSHLDPGFMERGEILGLSFTTPYLLILFQVHLEESSDMGYLDHEMMSGFYDNLKKDSHDLLLRWGHGRYVYLKSCVGDVVDRPRLDQELNDWQRYIWKRFKQPLSAGIAKSPRNKYLKPSYLEAKKALQIALKQHGVIYYEDLVLDILVEDVPLEVRRDFLNRTLTLLNSELKATLRAYFQHQGSMKDASRALHIHVNTLHYRLRKLKILQSWISKHPKGLSSCI